MIAVAATRLQLLPEVVDISIIPTAAGIGGLLALFTGAVLRLDPDRLGRLTLLGNLLGGVLASFGLLFGLLHGILF